MKEYKKKQYNIEYNYILNAYFNDIKYLTPFKKIDDRKVVACDVMFNNEPYLLYKYELGGMLLMPKIDDIFKGDFNCICELHAIKDHGILFTITKKQNGIIINYYYLFTVNEHSLYKNYVDVNFTYTTINDKDNLLYKKYIDEGVTEELFITRRGYNRLELDKIENQTLIKKYENGLCEKHEYNSNGFQDENINISDDASLIYTIDNLNSKIKKYL